MATGPIDSLGQPVPPERPSRSAGFDAKAVTTPQWLIIGGAVAYLVALILPWLSVSSSAIPGLSQSANGFDIGTLVLAWILLLAAAAWLLLPGFGVKLPTVSFPRELVTLGLTGLALLLTFIKFIDAVTSGGDLDGLGVDVDTGVGAYLGLLAALAAVAGAVMLFRATRATPAGPTL